MKAMETLRDLKNYIYAVRVLSGTKLEEFWETRSKKENDKRKFDDATNNSKNICLCK